MINNIISKISIYISTHDSLLLYSCGIFIYLKFSHKVLKSLFNDTSVYMVKDKEKTNIEMKTMKKLQKVNKERRV